MYRRPLVTLSLLIGVLWTPFCSGAEVPVACQIGPRTPDPKSIRDLSGELPIPDYFETILSCNGLSLTGPRDPYLAPPSAWLETERRLYAGLLANYRADVLVVPFQVQGYGLDRVERAVMTADLAYAIGSTRQYAVADPFLVARALGEGMRRLDPEAIEALATSLGAKKIVVAYVGHDDRHSLTLTIQVRDPLPAPGQQSQAPWQKDWRKIAFTDERTPFVVFHEMLPDILRSLPLKLPAPARATATPSSANVSTVTGTPLESVTTNANR